MVPTFRKVADLTEVGVAGDHVQPPVERRIGVRLVARVDDRALERGLEADLLLEEVGTRAELVVDVLGAVLGADLAGAGEHLAAHEPREQVAHQRGEGHGAVDEVVLVGAVRVALAVGVVLVDDDLLPGLQQRARRQHRAGEDALPRLVGDDELEGVGALRGGVLGVRVVDVVAGPVGEDRVDQVGLDLRWGRALPGEAAGVAPGRLVLEVPADLVVLDVPIDEYGRGQRRGWGRPRRASVTPYSVSIPQTLGMATSAA